MEEAMRSHVCAVCQKRSSYVCPRCGINYCSLDCYRAPTHERCSESFYRDCCMSAMRSRFVDPENKTKMLEILQREASAQVADNTTQINNEENPELSEEVENSDSGSDKDDFELRFSDLNLESNDVDADTIWTRLTLKERRDFHRLLSSGAVASYLPTWEPWWLDSKPNIEEVAEANKRSDSKPTKSSKISPLPLKKIFPSGKLPHKSVGFVLTEVVLAHAFLCRLYNGDCKDLVHEYLMRLNQLAPSLCPSRQNPSTGERKTPKDTMSRTVILTTLPTHSSPVYTSISQVIGALQLRLSDLRLPCSPQVAIVLLGDLHALLSKEERYLPRFFAEMLDLVRLARRKAQFEDDEAAEISRNQMQAMYKKLQFLQTCVNPSDPDARSWRATVLPSIRSQTTLELCRHVSDFDPTERTTSHRGPVAGPNWRNMIRSVTSNTDRPLITDLGTKTEQT